MRRGVVNDFITNDWELDFCKLCKKETFIVEDLSLNLVPFGFTIFCGKKCFWYTTSETSANLYCKEFGINFFPISNREKLFTLSSAISPSLDFVKPKVKDGFSFRLWQEALIEYCQLAGNVLVADEMRLGKEQPHSSPILTPTGWTTMGEIKINDLVVGSDGKEKRIVNKFPQGIKDIYKITFNDKTEVFCGLEHLWKVKSNNDKRRGKDWRVLSTKELINPRKLTWEIPIVEPVEFKEKEFLINPYLLGVLIADGSLTGSSPKFVPGDGLVPKEVSKVLSEDYYLNEGADYGTSTCFYINKKDKKNRNEVNPIFSKIKEYGLDVVAQFKHIPEEYKFASIEQRKSLLQGLMDCDGSSTEGKSYYSTTSEQLANDVRELVQSLGGIATMGFTKGRTRDRDGRTSVELDCYYVGVQTNFNPFRAKYFRWQPRKADLRKFIKTIEFSHREEASCIQIESEDNLYVTNGFTLTHNSYGVLGFCLYEDKVLIVVPHHLKETWKTFIETIHPNPSITLLKPRSHIQNGFNIINYDILHTLNMSQVNTAIVDEAHMVKEFDARRTKAIHSIIADKKIALTGTPVLNKLGELISILKWLDDKWGKVFIHNQYVSDGSFRLDKNQLETELRSTCLIKRTKALVSDSLPIKENVIKIDCPEYLRGVDFPFGEIAKKRLQIGLYKVPCVVDYCNIYKEKLVVFTYHEDVILRLKASLGNISDVIYGKTSQDERENIISKFKNGVIRIILLSIPVGAVGIDLSCADRILFAEQDWNLLMEQAKERCSDMVKNYHVMVETMVVESSLDEKMFNDLKRKDKEQL
jgi:hypothetical protein